MDFLFEFSDLPDINSVSLENIKHIPDFNILIDTKTQAGGSTKPYLTLTRQHFQKLLADLNLVLAHLESIKKAGEEYAQKKTPASLEKVSKAIQSIKVIFENDDYRFGQYGHDFFNPLYDFMVITGENMDQREFMPLGTASYGESGPDKISIEGLGLAKIDINKPKGQWLPILEQAVKLITTEKEKVKTYLRRLDYIQAYQNILAQGGDYYSIKEKVYQAETTALQKKLLTQTQQYMSLAIELLQEIKSSAEKNLKTFPDETARKILSFHASQLVDELDRLASHSHFNGMSLFTGYFSKENQDRYPMNMLIGPEITQTLRLYLPTLTSDSLITPPNLEKPWEWDVSNALSSEQGTKELIQRIDAAMQKINESSKEVNELLSRIPVKNPYSELVIDTLLNKKINNTLAKYKLQNKLSYIAKPDQSINTQNTLLLLILKNAHDEASKKLLKMRELAVASGNSVYTDEDRMKFNKTFLSLIKEIENISLQTTFNGERLLDSSSKYFSDSQVKLRLTLDERGDLQKELALYTLDTESLGLSRGAGYTIEIQSPDQGNMAIGIIDMALRIINRNKVNISACLQSAVIGEFKDNANQEYIKESPPAKVEIDYFSNKMVILLKLTQFSRDVCTKMKMYSWTAVSGIYTAEDRMNFSHLFRNFLEDAYILLNYAKELSDGLPNKVKLDEQQKQSLAAFNSYLLPCWKQVRELKEEPGSKEALQTSDSAMRFFAIIDGILQLKE
jgi:flagellin-like hook-associated protein FlgL